MGNRRRYKKKADQFVVAVQLDLDTKGFTYRKWGAEQRCKKDDWIVDNGGDIYSVDAEVFAKTYRKTGDGTYVKTTPIWAEKATQKGSVITKEGKSQYQSGDYLVYNNEDGTDAYCISAAKFESMYELDEQKLYSIEYIANLRRVGRKVAEEIKPEHFGSFIKYAG